MKRLMLAALAIALAGPSAANDDVKIGIILGFTGPIESLTPDMAAGAELAISEVNEAGGLLGGHTVAAVRGDSTCIDNAAASAAAERLITADGVSAIMGADCSGVTGAILQNVARPNGVVMISPSATSPALTTAEDDGLFFRTSPSDARQGEVMANVISERGIGEVAISYVNADYGKGLADSFQSAFEAIGGKVTLSSPHEDGKADYSAEVGALASAGGEALVVAGYADSGGKGIIQASLDTGAFDVFVLPDGMVADSLLEAFGTALDGSFGQVPGSDNPGAAALMPMLEAIDVNPSAPFVAESYDAAALLMLAVEAAGSSDSQAIKDNVIAVANAPGEAILPGQLGMAIEILAGGGEVDYQGGTGVELIGPGEAAGSYRLFEIQEGQFSTLGYR